MLAFVLFLCEYAVAAPNLQDLSALFMQISVDILNQAWFLSISLPSVPRYPQQLPGLP